MIKMHCSRLMAGSLQRVLLQRGMCGTISLASSILHTPMRTLSSFRALTPRRALMYVPGSDERKLAKVPQLGADCVCLDCEDGVAASKKTEARENIRSVLDSRRVDFGGSECSVRVNSVESGLCGQDVRVVLGGENLPSALHLPKVSGRDDLLYLRGAMEEALGGRHEKMGLIMFIESARSLLDIDSICSAARQLSEEGAPFVPEALVFGSDDFAADIGATRTKENTELLVARQQVDLASYRSHFYSRRLCWRPRLTDFRP